MRAILAGLTLAVFAAVGSSKAQYDPAASRAENQANALNRSMTRDQQNRSAAQQNQFETNALRTESSRPSAPLVPYQAAPGRTNR